MKRVIFFMEPEWAFGSIHYELCKYFFRRGINASVLPWNKSYSLPELAELDSTTDFYLTNPHGYRHLTYSFQLHNPEKCIMIAHSKSDLEELIEHHGVAEFDRPRHFGVVSKYLVRSAAELGIERVPVVLDVGINVNSYRSEPSAQLRTVGLAGSATGYHQHIKRAHLAEQAAAAAGLEYLVAQSYHNSYVTMPGFYKKVDAILVASTQEGAGLPVLEASAAGKLVISTPVGHWCERHANSGGYIVPIDESGFLYRVNEILQFYRDRPVKYREKCWEIQQHAWQYDWDNFIDQWIALVS
jgi:glycosyltransferase involved in cell wall biosynthesis